MSKSVTTLDPPIGAGLMSVILGSVGLLLFFMPVLGVPLGAAGLVFGLIGVVLARWGGWTSLWWSIAGVALSGLALSISVAIAEAPAGFVPARSVPLDTQPVPDQPYIAPPARPEAAPARTGSMRQGLDFRLRRGNARRSGFVA